MGKTKIMAVDDDLTTRLILQSTLEEWGYEPVICSSGEEAADIITNGDEPPELLIVDWMMPGLNGLELCKRIRDTHQQEKPYILMLTSRSARADYINALDAGADDYLTKPYENAELKEKIEQGLA